MESHVKIVAVLNMIFGGMGLLAALVVLIVFGGTAGVVGSQADKAPDAEVAAGILAIIGGAIFVVALVVSLPCIIAGLGLLKYREWARILTIVLSAFNLLAIPLGTVIGAYSLWVLLSRQTQALFPRKAPPAQAA